MVIMLMPFSASELLAAGCDAADDAAACGS
jgi:hypothetical protein